MVLLKNVYRVNDARYIMKNQYGIEQSSEI